MLVKNAQEAKKIAAGHGCHLNSLGLAYREVGCSGGLWPEEGSCASINWLYLGLLFLVSPVKRNTTVEGGWCVMLQP